ncbi:hypothetical protein LCGC14_1158190 [marine sediment metagenome]|uniref:Uncharacterized protein n=1 Tax=marine sediment metagenome TaxID=412755 RepID=A0A0F9LTI7_9ZZZZ
MKGFIGSVWTPVFVQIDLKNATLKLIDGDTPTPNEIEIKIGEGNLTYSENKNIEYTLNRGLLDEVREGDEVPMDIAFDLVWDYISGNQDSAAVPPLVEDVLKNINNAAGWISTDSDTCRPFAVDVVIEYVPDCGAGAAGDIETITLPDFRYETLDHDLRAGTISCSGRCNAKTATVVRAAGS